MIAILIKFIDVISQVLILLVIVSAILSYVMAPYHPIRRAIDGVIEPLLAPIRRVVPLLGMIDISPIILIILVQIVSYALIKLLSAFR